MPKKKVGKEKKVKKDSKEDVIPTHNKKFGINILLVSLFLVLLIVLVYYLSKGESGVGEKAAELEKLSVEDENKGENVKTEEEFLQEAKQILEKQLLDQEVVETKPPQQDFELKEKALQELDLSICEQITSDLKDSCRNEIFVKKALLDDDVENCNKIIDVGAKGSCNDFYYHNKAKKTGDKSFCEEITKPFLKEDCGK